MTLWEDGATWVRLAPEVPHGAINRGRRPALVVIAVLRHGPSDPRAYQARPIPLPWPLTRSPYSPVEAPVRWRRRH
jgi:hypothetical protein